MRELEDIISLIRDVPDFPKPGIVFKDITPLIASGKAFAKTINLLAEKVSRYKPDAIVGIESRGFIFGAALASRLGLGLLPVRKPGKLPYRTRRKEYALEYGTDALEMHEDAIAKDQRILIVDDLLATGGTASATCDLVTEQGGNVVGVAFVVELGFLNGRKRIEQTVPEAPIEALIEFA